MHRQRPNPRRLAAPHPPRLGESGATAIEYALIAVLIAVAIVGAVTALSGRLGTLYASVSNAF
jgi:pilus assembly protein Flp/PilA